MQHSICGKRKYIMDDANDHRLQSQEESAAKRLRCTEPDLKVILHNANDTKIYHMYSHVLAKQSKFVDTCLSVDMQEKTTNEIVFQYFAFFFNNEIAE